MAHEITPEDVTIADRMVADHDFTGVAGLPKLQQVAVWTMAVMRDFNISETPEFLEYAKMLRPAFTNPTVDEVIETSNNAREYLSKEA